MSSISILSILSMVYAVAYGFGDYRPAEIFFTDSFTYLPLRCANTIYLHLKTKSHAEIRLRTKAMGSQTRVYQGYELCLGCRDHAGRYKAELWRNGVSVMVAMRPRLNASEWNSFTIAWSYADRRLIVGQKGNPGPILHWLELPTNELIPIEYVGIRTHSSPTESNHWIIGRGDRNHRDFRALMHSGFEIPFQPEDAEGCSDTIDIMNEPEIKAKRAAHERAKEYEEVRQLLVEQAAFERNQALNAAEEEARRARSEFELRRRARFALPEDIRGMNFTGNFVLHEDELKAERKYKDEMVKARNEVREAYARLAEKAKAHLGVISLPEERLTESPTVKKQLAETLTDETSTEETLTAETSMDETSTDKTSKAENPTTENQTTENPTTGNQQPKNPRVVG